MENEILVTDWGQVEADDFYLGASWQDELGGSVYEDIAKARELQKEGKLYVAYIVDAKNYAIYTKMDAHQVFIDGDCDIILHCESAIISNSHGHRVAVED